jgi:hypothetical protein
MAEFRNEIRGRLFNRLDDPISLRRRDCFDYVVKFVTQSTEDVAGSELDDCVKRSVACQKLAGWLRHQADRIKRRGERTPSIDVTVESVQIAAAPSQVTAATATATTPPPYALKRKATINARMLEKMQAIPEAMGWSSTKWAKELHCAKSSVVATKAWNMLKGGRERISAERALDRHRRPKASDQKLD